MPSGTVEIPYHDVCFRHQHYMTKPDVGDPIINITLVHYFCICHSCSLHITSCSVKLLKETVHLPKM